MLYNFRATHKYNTSSPTVGHKSAFRGKHKNITVEPVEKYILEIGNLPICFFIILISTYIAILYFSFTYCYTSLLFNLLQENNSFTLLNVRNVIIYIFSVFRNIYFFVFKFFANVFFLQENDSFTLLYVRNVIYIYIFYVQKYIYNFFF